MIKTIKEYKIIENGLFVGEIALWQYNNHKLPHLEYKVLKEYQNQGIMKKHLPIFLKQIAGAGEIVAVVEPDNLVSIKLLQNNNFKELGTINNYKTFIYVA